VARFKSFLCCSGPTRGQRLSWKPASLYAHVHVVRYRQALVSAESIRTGLPTSSLHWSHDCLLLERTRARMRVVSTFPSVSRNDRSRMSTKATLWDGWIPHRSCLETALEGCPAAADASLGYATGYVRILPCRWPCGKRTCKARSGLLLGLLVRGPGYDGIRVPLVARFRGLVVVLIGLMSWHASQAEPASVAIRTRSETRGAWALAAPRSPPDGRELVGHGAPEVEGDVVQQQQQPRADGQEGQ